MGILTDFATSSLGDLTIGAFEGLNEAAQKDVVVNATASNSALQRENNAYNLTELVYKNKDELKKKLLLNPSEFGLFAQDGQSLDSVADRFTNFMMLNNRSIFEHKNFNNVMLDAAKFMAAGIDQGGFTIYDPYISGENRFNQEKELHQARISEITKMPKADKLLMKIREAEEGVATPESITDELLKVQALTAKGFGILNTFPTSFEGRKNLESSMVSIIVSNAVTKFPDDSEGRQTFINQKLYENNIDPLDGIRYKSDVTYSQMAKIMETEGLSIANQINNLTAAMATASGEKLEQINNQKNLLALEQHKLVDKYSSQAVAALAGDDRSTIFPEERTAGGVPLPLAAEGYVPTINSEGNLIIDLANGNRQALPIDVLIESPDSVKLLPIEAQNYVNQIKSKLFIDGEMIKPTREMFEDGAAGDKAFRDFLNIHRILGIEEMDMTEEGTGVTDIDPLSEKEKIKKEFEKEKESFKDADITKFKEAPKGDEIKIEELPPANTIVPKKKPDQPEEPKEKSLQEKIQKDFPSANVGTSGGDTTLEQGTKEKTDTQKQTEDIFEGSGVEPMYQSAKFEFDTINRGYLVNQWSKNYQGEDKFKDKARAVSELTFKSFDVPEEALAEIGQVANVFSGQNNFSEDNIVEMLSAIGFIESKYETKIQKGGGPARSYWQVEPQTAKDILKQNLQANNPILGQKFEDLFKSKYSDQIGNRTALQYFASLNNKQLSKLLEQDGLFAATMAGFKVVTTFDPFNTKGA